MKIFRTTYAQVPSKAQTFIRRVGVGSIQALFPAVKDTKDMVREVFSYQLPIQAKFESRFGPAGLMNNVLYTSDSPLTTQFEIAYHLIRKFGPPYTFNCATYELALCADPKNIIDVSQQENAAAILDPKTYTHSHAWIRSLKSLDTVKYPNVRNAGSAGVNYAIYQDTSVVAGVIQPSQFQMTVINTKSAQIGSTVISPIM